MEGLPMMVEAIIDHVSNMGNGGNPFLVPSLWCDGSDVRALDQRRTKKNPCAYASILLARGVVVGAKVIVVFIVALGSGTGMSAATTPPVVQLISYDECLSRGRTDLLPGKSCIQKIIEEKAFSESWLGAPSSLSQHRRLLTGG